MLLTPLPLKPILEYEKLLLKQAQLVLNCQKLQTKASRPAQPRASPPRDDPQDYSKAIALMRKTYFANVNEYERSGRLKIPPLEDPCGAGILPASPSNADPMGMPTACPVPPSSPLANSTHSDM